jgi:hypothetical protein
MAEDEQCNSQVAEVGYFGEKNFTDHSGKNFSKICKLIILQLEAAMPASLPFQVIFDGVMCECRDVCEIDVVETLGELMANGLILRVGECGFCDRFALIEFPSSSSCGGGE